jgi:hypothetical protein
VANRVVLDNAAIGQLLRGPRGDVAQDVVRRGNNVLNLARRLCNVDQGGMRASLEMIVTQDSDGIVVRVGSRKTYAAPVNNGSRPHWIERTGPLLNAAGRVRTLRFESPPRSGNAVYRRKVYHPGYAGSHFLERSLVAAV